MALAKEAFVFSSLGSQGGKTKQTSAGVHLGRVVLAIECYMLLDDPFCIHA